MDNSSGSDAYQKYLDYDWNADARWNIHKLNVVAPPGVDEQVSLERIRRKYYQRHIDSSVIFPDDSPQPSTSTPPPSTSNSSPSYSGSSSSSYDSTSTSSSSSSSSYNSGSSSAPQQSPQQQFKLFSVWGALAITWLAANLYLLFHVILFVLSRGYPAYFNALLGAAVSYIVNLGATFGMPQFNMAWFMRLSQHESFHYFALCLVFLSYPPVILIIPMLAIYSFFNTCAFLQQMLPNLLPGASPIVLPWVIKALAYQTKALGTAANIEALMMPLVIFKCLFSDGGILMVIMYWQFLNYRYLTNVNVRTVLLFVGQKLDDIANQYLPGMIRGYYFTARRFFGRFVDPAYMQQTYQSFTNQRR